MLQVATLRTMSCSSPHMRRREYEEGKKKEEREESFVYYILDTAMGNSGQI